MHEREFELRQAIKERRRIHISGVDEAEMVAEALLLLGTVYEDEDGKVIGDRVLAQQDGVVQFPHHGIATMRATGRTWTEAFAALGVDVVERTTLDGRIKAGDWVLYQNRVRVVKSVGEGDWLSLAGFGSATYECGVPFSRVPASAVTPCTPAGVPR